MLSANQGYQTETRDVPVRVLYEDGSEISGSILIPRLSDFTEILGADPPFLTFKSGDGETSYIYTSKIRSICPTSQPRVKPLDLRKDISEEPYKLLNVTHEDGFEVVKRAYESALERYDPTRDVTPILPDEVIDYFKAMTQAIKQAYSKIERSALEEA